MNKLLLLILLISGLSIAQYKNETRNDLNTRFGIGITAAWFNPVDADNGGIMGGLVARAKFMKFFGAELSVNYRSEDYGSDFVSVTTVPVLLSALVYPVDFLYGLAGIGYYNTSIEYSGTNLTGIDLGDESSGEVGGQFGLGLTFPISDRYRMFGDIRYHLLGYELKRLDNVAQSISSYNVDANFLSVNLGLLIEF
ncbi:MAG: outer membrane beta-barrel protein [Syntrophothermus sp.]|nr:outer membrane beta-barrel protein [Ignavibacteriaceae bacterium]